MIENNNNSIEKNVSYKIKVHLSQTEFCWVRYFCY